MLRLLYTTRHIGGTHGSGRDRRLIPPHQVIYTDAPYETQDCRLQVVRRSDHGHLSLEFDRRRRSERLRQIEHHRRGALGDGRDLRQAPARRVDGGRDLQRLLGPQALGQRLRGIGVRQFRGQARRCVRELQRSGAAPLGEPRRHLGLFHQRHQGSPQGHHAAVSRHRIGNAQLRHHRARHDLARDRGAPGRPARVSRGSGRHLALQGAPPRDREPDRPDAREPRSVERSARGSGQANPPSAAPGRHRAPLSSP